MYTGWFVVMSWMVTQMAWYVLAEWRSRRPARWPDDDFIGEVHVDRELRRAERDFAVGIDRIDDAYGLSRPRRRRVDPGVSACRQGGHHEEV
jgi:hypothetical protein